MSRVWAVAGGGDFGADAGPYIVWRNTNSGKIAIWQIDDLAKGDAKTFGTELLVWRIQ